jgi:hypothetical protein
VNGGYTSEIKFVVTAATGRDIAAWVREHLTADVHGGGPYGDEYHVTSLYFDTGAADVFHRRGSYGRSKYRIRRYGQEQTVFLERKLRTATLLAKRRTRVGLDTLEELVGRYADPGDPARWFARRLRLRRLAPVCQVSYRRIARHAETPAGPARLTLDGALQAAANSACGFSEREGTALLDGDLILEIKYRSHIPAAFKQLVEQFRLNPRPASKYRIAAKNLGVVGVHA